MDGVRDAAAQFSMFCGDRLRGVRSAWRCSSLRTGDDEFRHPVEESAFLGDGQGQTWRPSEFAHETGIDETAPVVDGRHAVQNGRGTSYC